MTQEQKEQMSRQTARQVALKAAREAGHTYTQIGRDIGTTGGNVRVIAVRGGKHSPFLQPLDEWLIKRGFWPMGQPGTQNATDPLRLVAGRLRSLADFIESDNLPPEVRVEELAASIKSLHDGLSQIVEAVERFRR